ncbi:MAG: hypothetical protein EXR71_04690 [Myxococcales bacterium]|nr:hypothetical protein [Myxococcales bacterium]
MGEMLNKPDTNPILVGVLGWIGYLLMGQTKKGIIGGVACLVFGWCCGIGFLFYLVMAYDAYLLGQKLQSGQSIGLNENGLEFLNMIFKD